MAETVNQLWAATLVGALAARGVRHAVIAPGSRSTPLALAFAERPDVTVHSVIDERSAGFVGLGLSKATGAPAAVLCTSGTAGAHFLPAVIEASEGHTPLMLLTADRPWELHGFGAPQTIEQGGLFGRFVRGAQTLAAPEVAAPMLEHLAAVTSRFVDLATGRPRGPVHLNVPFREPLAPDEAQPVVRDPRVPSSRRANAVPPLDEVLAAIAAAQRGVIVVGPRERDDDFASAVHALSERLGFPVLAEAASNARYGFEGAIATCDALLRHEGFAAAHRPDVVLRFGGGLTARGPQAWLDASGARQFLFSDDGAVFDPLHRAEAVFEGDAVAACEGLRDARRAPCGERAAWLEAQRAVLAALEAEAPTLSEPLVAREVVAALPAGASLVLSSSMPIRDVDAFAPRARGPLRVFANRGVNGIDGVLSTALGVALGRPAPTLALLGDVAALHDLSGWLSARRVSGPFVAVIVNNDGGGIFHFLPVAGRTPHFEALFGTPHGVDLSHVAALAGAALHRPESLASLRAAVARGLEGGLHLIEVRTDRRANVAEHRALFARLVGGLP